MGKKYFIHLSDSHISSENIRSTEEINKALINDIKSITSDGEICLIIYTGDLVYSGSKANFELAFDKFISPMLTELNLPEDKFIYVPGNHEVDISKVNEYFNNAFTESLISKKFKPEDFHSKNITDRLQEFFDFIKLFCDWTQNNLVNTKIVTIGELKIGLSMINTAWNTAGDSKFEAKKIVIPRDFLVDSLSQLNDTNIKIAIMHHPADWFEDDNAAEIEIVLSKYDFILSGHKHHTKMSSILHMNNNTICSMASKLDISNEENGYAIISFDQLKNDVTIYNRTYNKKRMEYTPNIDIANDGIITYNISGHLDNEKQLVAEIILNSRKNFYDNLDQLFIINLLDKNKKRKFDEIFVKPKISKFSEFIKEKQDDPDEKEIDLFEEIKCRNRITFWGLKETGKTILAYYIAKLFYDNYQQLKKIPIVIDCKFLDSFKTSVIPAIHSTINALLESQYSISKDKIIKLAENGNFVIIFDNFDSQEKVNNAITYFSDTYGNNKIIYIRNEMPGTFSDEDKALLLGEDTSENPNYFIRNMDKHNIRLLAKNIAALNPAIEDEYVDKIVYSFSTNNIPRTPFAVSLILSICSEAADYTPTNQAKIVENFMERLLEKLNPDEVFSKSYDFSNKEKFLASLAYEMHKDNCYYMDEARFAQFVKEYHELKGYDVKDSKFNTIFFEKGILVNNSNFIYFRYECLIHYYLAKYCISNNEFFNNEILSKENYLNYLDSLNYYTGLNRENPDVLLKIMSYLSPYIEQNSDFGDLFEVDSIKLQLSVDEDNIEQQIKTTKKLDSEEKDKLTDMPDNSHKYDPETMKTEKKLTDDVAFSCGLELLGSIIRNSEELEAEVKSNAFSLFIQGCLVAWKDFRNRLLDYAKVVNEFILAEAQKNESNMEEIKEDLATAFERFSDFIKISVPIVLSGVIFNSIGTEKLKLIFNGEYQKYNFKDPKKLLMTMLLCDLKDETWNKKIADYIKNTKKKDFLWIMFFKCQYYYQFNYFSNKTDKIIEPLAECIISLNNANKKAKAHVIKGIKKQKKLLDD